MYRNRVKNDKNILTTKCTNNFEFFHWIFTLPRENSGNTTCCSLPNFRYLFSPYSITSSVKI